MSNTQGPSNIEELRERLRRPASLMRLDGPGPPDDPVASWIGRVDLAGPDEEWPTYQGSPMAPVFQTNCQQLAFLPTELEDLALITFFIATQDGEMAPWLEDYPETAHWSLRTYSALSPLVSLEAPQPFSSIKPQIVGWEKIVDLPAHDNLYDLVDPQVVQELVGQDVSVLGQPLQGSKVGGYPCLIQSAISWAPHNRHPSNPQFVIQIDSHEDLGITWGDGGVLYLGRGTGVSTDSWAMEWQCY